MTTVFTICAATFTTTILMTLLVQAKDTRCHSDIGKGNDNIRHTNIINCYFCSSSSTSSDHFCGDPFNLSHPALTTIPCEGYCAKWVIEKTPGELRYTRTCSKHMQMKMHINLVCMKERGSHKGHLCFCGEHGCNLATTPSISMTTLWILALMVTS
ncbi:uncharacterized protein LOC126822209 [Patella vulgata]|uniref:uncharacterized protein LOC126822209 n=1 Tax=Patella vulgata TaxID=6465 RepID=UPI00217F4E5E|nr:uncharacterized protein LOC126822209 [Patella vulgata]